MVSIWTSSDEKFAYTFLHSQLRFAIILTKIQQINFNMWHLSEVPAGAVVVCEIFHLFEHTGIYVGEGQIVELQGSGLVRAVSINRFFDNRSGKHLLVACDAKGSILLSEGCAERAIQQIFTVQDYDLIHNNCHRFTQHCVTGRNLPITSFFDLKTELARFWRTDLQWVAVDLG